MSNFDVLSARGGFCTETRPGPCGMIIFGASGDLTHRKLMPALYRLFEKGLLPERFFVVGCARSEMTDDAFRESILKAIQQYIILNKDVSKDFLKLCFYHQCNYYDPQSYASLSRRLYELNKEFSTNGNRVFYLATPPDLYCPIAQNLGSTGLVSESNDQSQFVRVVIEKPYGRDLESAIALDKEIHKYLDEDQIYRIDHYLGKETVQNILMFRFANTVFEPIWDRRYIDHVQITVAETIGVEHRAGYFDRTGLLRDMFQNHIMQMLALVAMEPPTSFNSDRVRDERVKLLRSLRPVPLDEIDNFIIRGQYGSGIIDGKEVPAYRQERNVAPDSRVETFVAAKVFIDNWRWQGVPFYIRTGKRLAQKLSEICVIFKRVPYSMFNPIPPEELAPNVLVINVQPEEGISLTIQAKKPGAKLCIGSLTMDFRYKDVFGVQMPDAYERLLLDCMLGDQTLFWRSDDVEVTWSFVTPVLNKWETDKTCCPLRMYEAGSWGPKEAEILLERDGRRWLKL